MKHLCTKLILVSVVFCITASAAPERKMLEQGKIWYYNYHHFEDRANGYDETLWEVNYHLEGDTVIDGRQYMKMYRWAAYDDGNGSKKYYGAFREDEEGRVYMYSDFAQGDRMVLDFSLHYDEGYFPDVTRISETIKVGSRLFRRYRYQDINPNGNTYDLGYVAVEGVGFQGNGLMFDPYAPQPDCICDYEELALVSAKDFWFEASGFLAPKEIELTEDERQLIASNNDFAFNLFRRASG